MKVQFKFNEDASGRERKEVLDRVQEHEAQVEQLFPEEHDPELSSLFVADLSDADDLVPTIMAMLEHSPAVEFAEAEVERKLIRPPAQKRRLRRRSRGRSST